MLHRAGRKGTRPTYSHCRKSRLMSDNFVDIFRNERLAILLKLVIFQAHFKLFHRRGRINDRKLPHKHDPGRSHISRPIHSRC